MRRLDWASVRLSLSTYTWSGLVGALIFALLSMSPSLLPRPALFQAAVTGVTAAIGYGLGVAFAWVWRAFADRPPRPPSRALSRGLIVVAVLSLVIADVTSVGQQDDVRRLMGMPEAGFWRYLIVPALAAVIFALLVGGGRLLRAAARRLSALLARHVGPLAARATAIVIVSLATVLVASGVVYDNVIDAIDRSFAFGDQQVSANLERPTSTLRSGGNGSTLAWEDLGRQGRRFVARGPSPQQITDLTGREAREPIRIYAGTANASDVEERARLAVEDLHRAGGFDRSFLLVAGTTGSGFLEPSAVDSFEYLTVGDSAIVSMQYSHLPSWISFLVDQSAARRAGRALFDAVYQVWTQLPPGDRPALYVFGESLGSFALETAFSGEADLANRVAGGLLVGPPNFNSLFSEFRGNRDVGSREIEPVYRGGRVVRFSTNPSEPIEPVDTPWDGPRVLYLVQPSDPITWWSPDLLWKRPDWLEEERGTDVAAGFHWYPIVTFWQTAADMAVGMAVPAGHGHNFVGRHVDGWRAVLEPDWWTDEMNETLTQMIVTDHADRAGVPPSMQVD